MSFFWKKKIDDFWSFFRPYFLPNPLVEATAGLHMDHMGAPKDFGRKYGRKNDQNLTNFFFQKIDIKTRSETWFHKNRTKTRDFNLFTARHEKSTAPESGTNSKCCCD